MAKIMKRGSGFTKGSGCYICQSCNKKTRDDGNGDSVHVRLCTKCYEEGGFINEHMNDGHPEGYNQACPICKEEKQEFESKAMQAGVKPEELHLLKDSKVTEQEMFEIKLCGETFAVMVAAKPEFIDSLMYAMQILSDAQEVMKTDKDKARQFINKAKYFISHYRIENGIR